MTFMISPVKEREGRTSPPAPAIRESRASLEGRALTWPSEESAVAALSFGEASVRGGAGASPPITAAAAASTGIDTSDIVIEERERSEERATLLPRDPVESPGAASKLSWVDWLMGALPISGEASMAAKKND
jgi:hypothetical protein